MQRKQILFVSGGLTFKDNQQAIEYYKNKDIDEVWDSKSWREWLFWSLENQADLVNVKMPMKDSADYEVWKIIFEKYFVKLNSNELVLIGYSLGTIFLMKYLLENGFSKKIKQLHLVAPIVGNEFQPATDTENTGTFTFDYQNISQLEKYCEEIYIWHSKDDAMCSFKNAQYINENLPKSILQTFENRGHFFQSTFFELFDVLRK